jgi:SAM-dependent methyltransferase
VLDAACGTGIVARAASSRVGATGHVTGVDLNPGMLEVARATADGAGQAIAWQESNLEALPFADGSFDVVLCQQGLQFCPDKAAAVAELRRVLRAGGRLALSVWRDIRHFPYILAVTGALADHVSAEASQRMSAPCSFGSADRLRAVLSEGGFKSMQVRIDILPMRVPSLAEFLPAQFAASPIAAEIGALDERARAAFFADIERRLLPYMDDAGLAVPFESHSVIALRGR